MREEIVELVTSTSDDRASSRSIVAKQQIDVNKQPNPRRNRKASVVE